MPYEQLAEAIARSLQPLLPGFASLSQASGKITILTPAGADSTYLGINIEDNLADGVPAKQVLETCVRLLLEEIQDAIIMCIHEPWPASPSHSPSDILPADVKVDQDTLYMWFGDFDGSGTQVAAVPNVFDLLRQK
jgi:hypothetical protein